MDDLVDHLAAIYDLAGRQVPREIGTTEEVIARLRSVTETHLALARAHRPGTVGCDVLFVRATERTQGGAGSFVDDRPDAWREHVSGHLEAFEVACRHQEMLDGGSLQLVGPLISERLRR
jgi:thioesterase domain-containing protein